MRVARIFEVSHLAIAFFGDRGLCWIDGSAISSANRQQ